MKPMHGGRRETQCADSAFEAATATRNERGIAKEGRASRERDARLFQELWCADNDQLTDAADLVG